ncbi:MAG: MFS transporter [bacterium]|jgi:predicted MFS family arabinose efflux permease|nr:MFS transporter [Betaproteobacteria bacterium]
MERNSIDAATAASPAGNDPRASAWVAVTLITLVQAVSACANVTLPTVAPKIAQTLGVDASWIGYQVSMLFGCAVLSATFGGGLVSRLGPARTAQVAALLSIVGMALAAVPLLATMVVATVLCGFALGLVNPGAAQVIVRFTPPRHRNLIFSVKQSGVPAGGVVVGLTAPLIAVSLGWQWSVLPAIVVAFAVLLLMQWVHPVWDSERNREAKLFGARSGGIGMVWARPALRWLALSGFWFAFIQRSVLTFLVSYLYLVAGYSLVEAGALLALYQAAGALARPVWGILADRTSGPPVLTGLSLCTMFTCLALFWLDASWSPALVTAIVAILGATSYGWNGVYHAEATRISPPREIATLTAGTSSFAYAGVLAGPALFAIGYQLVGSYPAMFGSLAAAAASGLGCLLLAIRHARRTAVAA